MTENILKEALLNASIDDEIHSSGNSPNGSISSKKRLLSIFIGLHRR